MSAQEYVQLKVEFESNHHYVINMFQLNILSALMAPEIIEDALEISKVVIHDVSFSQA